MKDEPLFLGETVPFWQEVQAKINELDDPEMFKRTIMENMRLRAKVSFYEAKIKELVKYVAASDSV